MIYRGESLEWKMLRSILLILALLSLASCAAPTQAPTITPEPSFTITKTSTPPSTPTNTPTPSETPIPLYRLSGTIFFDYNGSGEQDLTYAVDSDESVMEPGIPDVPVCLDADPRKEIPGNALCTVSDKDGNYVIENIKEGTHKFYVKSPTDDPATAFRYMNISHGWVDIPAYEMGGVQVPAQYLPDTEIYYIDKSITLEIGSDLKQNLGLMQGFLTSPFLCNQEYIIGSKYDHDPTFGSYLTYEGYQNPYDVPIDKECNSDNHEGLDLIVPDGVPVVAMASGIVNFSGAIETWHGTVLHITVEHFGKDFATGTGHHSVLLVDVGESVLRGQIIALSGHSGTKGPHVHINLHHPHKGSPPPTTDLYGVLYDVEDPKELISHWSVYNQIVCIR
jgi:hypothetical protein